MAKLVYKIPNGKSCEVKLKHYTTIGRHPAQDIQILDRVVSKAHAVIELDKDGSFYVRDIGSRNGTIVNGDRLINARHRLREGDEIVLGGTTLRYFDESEQAPQADRVTFQESADNAIRRRIDTTDSRRFLPEAEIADVDVLRRDYERLRIANELAREVGLQFDLDKLLDKILEKAFEVFPVDRGVILLRDPNTLEMRPASVRSRNNKEVGDIRISQTILKEVCDEKAAVLSSDAMLDSRFSGAHSIIIEGIRSAMSVPLLYGDELLGVIHLDNQLATGAFTDKDLQILTGFAQQAAVNIKHNHLLKEMEENIRARDKLRRLLSPHLVDDVLNGKIELKMGGERRAATVLFSDIRGFTSRTERTRPEAIVSMLNDYFERMVDIVFRYEGTLDKFVGDEIMAVWGAPMEREDHAVRAVCTALDMFAALAQLNQERAEQNEEPIEIGIGISTGEMIAGYMGSTLAMDYTVIGDTVNLGARLCSAAGPGEILINESTLEAVKDSVEAIALPPVHVKGKAAPVKLFRVIGRKQSVPELGSETYARIS
ncbi:MAG: adenylate/guanylate cyclase domain-containing protein [Myxococcota bacterium]|jgi:adenylate cyclase|nr:adenylate/guanylate cyclase domain-containing protein [Myxococcota bacterium]